MNLVAKEYVVSQNPDDPGVLLLSQFAGAADELKVGALLINPYNADEVAEQIHRALIMPLEERKERYQSMIEVLKHEDIFLWTKRFLFCLNTINRKMAVSGPKNDFINRVMKQPGKIRHYLPSLSELIRNLSLTA
jgi:trehalose 6-phosphate synthase